MSGNGTSSIQRFDKLKEAGFNEVQARALIEDRETNVSKEDLGFATAELKRDIKELDQRLKPLGPNLKGILKNLIQKLKHQGRT